MEYGKLISDSFAYTRAALVDNPGRWFLLFLCMIISPLYGGYQWKIYQGGEEAPELNEWLEMFINGIKMMIVGFIYFLIPFIVFMLLTGGSIFALALTPDDPTAATAAIAGSGIAILISLIVIFIFSLIATMAMIRFARTNSFGEALNIGAVTKHIGKIGWLDYIIAMFILFIVLNIGIMIIFFIMMIISVLLALIPIIGPLLLSLLAIVFAILIAPFIGIFSTRYLTYIYDSAVEA